LLKILNPKYFLYIMTKILITGATGFVGRALFKNLKSKKKYLAHLTTRTNQEELFEGGKAFNIGEIDANTDWKDALDGVDYRSMLPTNLYGPGDNYHPENSHVIPGLIYKFHKAKIKNLESVIIWGTGTPKREFLYVDDLAQAAIHVMNVDKKIYDEETLSVANIINVGSEKELTIKELAEIIKEVIDFKGTINFDPSKPDGTTRKLLNSERINKLGFKPKTDLKEGLIKTYQDYLKFYANV
jgi:nucleoside-diphosphate-sugar epimerase